jgi:hypothetical protein
MTTSRSLVLGVLCVMNFGYASAFGADSPNLVPAVLKAADLQADFAIFKRAYEELHPGLYRYNTQRSLAAHFSCLARTLDRDQSLSEAYLAFATFLTRIQCGHSYPNFYNQPDEIANALFKRNNRLPFHFRWLGTRMIVTRNLTPDARLAPGTEVVAINGVRVKQILQRLMTVSRADGANDDKRRRNLEVRGEDRYEAFDVYYPMFFPPEGERFKLRVRLGTDADIIALEVAASTYAERLASNREQVEALRGDAPLWQLQFLADRTAVLRMGTWALFNSKWDWKAFLDQAFEQILATNSPNLIIDLRGNEGGLSVGDVLLARLARTELHFPGEFKRWVRYRKIPEDLRPYLDTWDKSFRDWGSKAVDPQVGFFRLTKYDGDSKQKVIKASPTPFRGRTFVLIDAANSSATFEFARQVKESRLATLVGQPTGGNQRGINGGAFFFLRMPGSHLECDIPLIGFYPPEVRPRHGKTATMKPPNAGITPDIWVKPRIEDIRLGADTEMRIVLELCRRAARPAR